VTTSIKQRLRKKLFYPITGSKLLRLGNKPNRRRHHKLFIYKNPGINRL
jgi:hypothetical protein